MCRFVRVGKGGARAADRSTTERWSSPAGGSPPHARAGENERGGGGERGRADSTNGAAGAAVSRNRQVGAVRSIYGSWITRLLRGSESEYSIILISNRRWIRTAISSSMRVTLRRGLTFCHIFHQGQVRSCRYLRKLRWTTWRATLFGKIAIKT